MRRLGPQADLDGLVADAVEEGRHVHVVHAATTKEATLEAFATELDFPSWFGGNLDALADLLRHLASTSTQEWELVVDDLAVLDREDPRACAALRGLLGEVAHRYPRFHVTTIDR